LTFASRQKTASAFDSREQIPKEFLLRKPRTITLNPVDGILYITDHYFPSHLAGSSNLVKLSQKIGTDARRLQLNKYEGSVCDAFSRRAEEC